MGILLVGMSHKTAQVELREKLSMPEEKIPGLLAKLKSPNVQECMILSTCNRVEILAHCEHPAKGIDEIRNFLGSEHQTSPEALAPHLYILQDEEAIRHIFEVASSLDSMVVGEPQILGQIKNAYNSAFESRATGPVLNRLMHKAFFTAKRVKTETRIAQSAVSISYAAVELARKIFEDLDDKTVMLIGAGEMIELAARHLMNNGAKDILVTNRTYSRAVSLAQDFNGSAIRFDGFAGSLIRTDIIISSTGSQNYILRHDDVKEVLYQRRNKPILMIDIAVPRDLDPEINKIDNVYLYDIDDLQSVVDTNIQQREKEAEKAFEIVAQDVQAFVKWVASLDVTPLIVLLRERCEEIRRKELDKTLPRLNGISGKEEKAIEDMAAAMVNKILHGSLQALKSDRSDEEKALLARVLKEIFQLEDAPRSPEERD